MKKPDLDFSTMDVDDFMNHFDADDSGEEETSSLPKKVSKKAKKTKEAPVVSKKKKEEPAVSKKKKTKVIKEESPVPVKKSKPEKKKPKQNGKAVNGKKAKKQAAAEESADEEDEAEPKEDEGGSESSEEEDADLDPKSHKQALEKLKDTDPEFYKFLEQNDKKLLKFGTTLDDSEDEEEEEENEAESEEDEDESKLEVASDESDFEGEDGPKGDEYVTLKMLKQWQVDLSEEKPKIEVLRDVTSAFNSALASLSGDPSKAGKFVVEGAAVFNGVLQLCILHFQGALKRFLGADPANRNIQKCKKFKKVSSLLRIYLLDLSSLLEGVTSSNILTVVLKHLHQMASCLQAFSAITKTVLKRLVVLWSSGEETTRILSFLCILKITRQQQRAYLSNVLKFMYLSYVKNSRFVSPSSLSNINFMRRSLTELFTLDLGTSYQHAFLYIRQLAIHLRNAVTLKKKESFQTVYNWQYINSLRLWVDVLAATQKKSELEHLIYPLVTLIVGVIKLIPTPAYFPLRFHCCKMLADLARGTNTFIPSLPLVLEVLGVSRFNEAHKKLSMKPLKFTTILRVSQSQLDENAFRDEVIEQVYGLTLEILANHSGSVGFPDLAVTPLNMLKEYIKGSKNANYNRKLKSLVDKIQENASLIERERGKLTCQLKDFEVLDAWEVQMKNAGTPLLKLLEEYVKSTEKKKKREAADTDSINVSELPMITKKEGKRKAQEGPVELFPDSSGSEGEASEEEEVEVKSVPQKRKKVEKKKAKKPKKSKTETQEETEETVDIVEDLNFDDW